MFSACIWAAKALSIPVEKSRAMTSCPAIARGIAVAPFQQPMSKTTSPGSSSFSMKAFA